MSDPLASLPLSAFRVFEAAARLRSFTRAAQELGMTQAAVSWQVKGLERRLGQTLFKRLPREVLPTPAGERLARAATEAMTVLRGAVADLSETAAGVLAITTIQTLAGQWLAPRLGRFQLAHPEIALRLDTYPALRDLVRENLDLAIRSGSGAWEGMEAVWMMPSVYTPLCSPAFLLNHNIRQPADLLQAPRIGEQEWWGRWFDLAGVESTLEEENDLVFTADVQVYEVASAMGGQGVAMGSPIFFQREITAGLLVQPFDIVAENTSGHYVVYPEERRRSAKIALFRDWLLAEAKADPSVQRLIAEAGR
jgi:LysR family glycine cleavage system transcriptional activator